MMRLLTILALLLCALPARAAEPPLALSLSLSRDEVRPDVASMARTTLTIAVFSSSPVTTTASLQLPIDTARLRLVSGIVQSGLPGQALGADAGGASTLVWQGQIRQGAPALLVLTFEALPAAPPGLLTFSATAQDDVGNRVSAESAVRVGPVMWAAPARPTLRLYLPVLRR